MRQNKFSLPAFFFTLIFLYLPGAVYAQEAPGYAYNKWEAKINGSIPRSLSPKVNNERSISSSAYLPPLTTEDLYSSPFRKGKPVVYRVNNYTEYVYYKPGALEFLANVPGDLYRFTVNSFRAENLPITGIILGVTAIMVYYDQEMLDAGKRFGRSIGLKGSNNQKAYFEILGMPIRGPHDMDTALYFIGDGVVHISLAAGFLAFGLIKSDNRALQTASQLAEGMVTVGFATQFLKHVTGRESPFVSTRDGGRWVFFPDQIEYHKHVPNYDAYPSGHLATSMMTVTVIAENYPEKKWIRPLGYFLMALLSFEMVNNGVHWVSDYPLALAMGYALGKIAVSRGRMERRLSPQYSEKKHWMDSVQLYPALDGKGLAGLGLAYRF